VTKLKGKISGLNDRIHTLEEEIPPLRDYEVKQTQVDPSMLP